jgi:hypothetical protein
VGCEVKGAITLLLLLRDEEAVCSRFQRLNETLYDCHHLTPVVEGFLSCNGAGILGVGLGLGILCAR